jgi:CRISPR/Cas system-associated protein Csm6
MFAHATAKSLYARVGEFKQYSQQAQVVAVLKDYFEGFYRLLMEVDLHVKDQEQADELYGTVCTILINIVSLEEIDFR